MPTVQNNDALVSIMMPVYNGIRTLPLAVSSVLTQTYTNWMCIIVNDGSNDGTKEYLDSLQDKRFKIIHFPENKGRPYARQAALEAAEGKYLAFLDADDFYHTEKLEKQVEILEKFGEADLVSCGNLCYGAGYKAVSYRGTRNNEIETYSYGDKPNFALRTSLLKLLPAKEVKFNLQLKHAQDTDFLEKYMPGKKFIVMDGIYYYYSEFESVTKTKIIRTHYYVLRKNVATFKSDPGNSIKEFGVTFLKLLYTALLSPFVSNDYFLKKRGTYPDKNELRKFHDALKINGIER
jgi:glycosyltransferase involved in cell wall biosynthesis